MSYGSLTLSTPDKIFSRRYIEIFFLFFPENKVWHFIQIVSNRDNLPEMSNPDFCEKPALHGPHSLSVAFVHRHMTVYLWFFMYYKMLAYYYFSFKFQVDWLWNKLFAKKRIIKHYRYMMFYIFVILQPVELKLDNELEDISRSHNLSKKQQKKQQKNTNVPSSAYAFVRSSTRSSTAVTHPATNQDLGCLTLWKSQPL